MMLPEGGNILFKLTNMIMVDDRGNNSRCAPGRESFRYAIDSTHNYSYDILSSFHPRISIIILHNRYTFSYTVSQVVSYWPLDILLITITCTRRQRLSVSRQFSSCVSFMGGVCAIRAWCLLPGAGTVLFSKSPNQSAHTTCICCNCCAPSTQCRLCSLFVLYSTDRRI